MFTRAVSGTVLAFLLVAAFFISEIRTAVTLTMNKSAIEETENVMGDINGDFIVDIFDVILLSSALDSRPGSPNWNQRADLNSDGIVNVLDAIIMADNFGNVDGRASKMVEMGVWGVGSNYLDIPAEAEWVIAQTPDYQVPIGVQTILDWVDIQWPGTPIGTAADLQRIESAFRNADLTKFWGVLFINEEQYKDIIAFDSGLRDSWFDETLEAYDVYQQSHPGVTQSMWQDEMLLRMCRGLYDYLHSIGVKAGITVGCPTIMPSREEDFYGAPLLNYAKQNSDFIVAYIYTENLERFNSRTKFYMEVVESWTKPLKLWILTRPWNSQTIRWEREAEALEMKHCLDNNWTVVTYYDDGETSYTLMRAWQDMFKCLQLYQQSSFYTENSIYGHNLLTDIEGQTYGWVEPSSVQLLVNPDFKQGLDGWVLCTTAGSTPLDVVVQESAQGNFAVMTSNDRGYRGGIYQRFDNVEPNSIFKYQALIKTVDTEFLEAHVLYFDIYDDQGNWYGGSFAVITTTDWQQYELFFQTPNVPTRVDVYPALVFGKGQVYVMNPALMMSAR